MLYAKIVGGEIIKTGPLPRWLNDDGAPLTVVQWAAHGYLPIVQDAPPHDPLLQRLAQRPKPEWLIEAERVVATYDIIEIDIEELRQTKIQAATDMRWEVMTGGLTLTGGIEVGTGIDDQNRITSVVANAALAGLTDTDEVDFKAASGWVRISIGQIKAIAGAIGQHVQACYSAEREHHKDIAALTTREQIRDYDLDVGWPDAQPEPA